MLVPKILTALKDYNREKFLADLVAGVIVGVVTRDLLSSPLTARRIEAVTV